MESLFFLIPLSILLLALAAKIFVWAVEQDQFANLDQHGLDIFEEKIEKEHGEN
ncbi:MAG: cbb3-type cytochrome oxidase assembly protein CcoS [Pseudomonadales bacterium]|nr:cbb3-type cytochrome oxidase assembly protein CcoS [Pseudomonadales bacterium]